MGRIVVIKDFARALRDNGARVSDVKFDPGGGNNITSEHFSDPGDDSYPMPGIDYAIAVDAQRKGSAAIVGYADPTNIPKALIGDKRIYARDVNGDSVAEVWLKSDGSIVISNDNGSITLKSDGDVDITGALSIDGKDFGTHTHSQGNDGNGDTEVDTSVPL